VVTEQKLDFSLIPPQYSPDLIRMIERMLEKNPRNRPSAEMLFYWVIKQGFEEVKFEVEDKNVS